MVSQIGDRPAGHGRDDVVDRVGGKTAPRLPLGSLGVLARPVVDPPVDPLACPLLFESLARLADGRGQKIDAPAVLIFRRLQFGNGTGLLRDLLIQGGDQPLLADLAGLQLTNPLLQHIYPVNADIDGVIAGDGIAFTPRLGRSSGDLTLPMIGIGQLTAGASSATAPGGIGVVRSPVRSTVRLHPLFCGSQRFRPFRFRSRVRFPPDESVRRMPSGRVVVGRLPRGVNAHGQDLAWHGRPAIEQVLRNLSGNALALIPARSGYQHWVAHCQQMNTICDETA